MVGIIMLTIFLVINNTTSGAIGINEVILHGAVPGLPFGGVGTSGCELPSNFLERDLGHSLFLLYSAGAHKGYFSFKTFTHERASIDNPGWVDYLLGWRYPPFSVSHHLRNPYCVWC